MTPSNPSASPAGKTPRSDMPRRTIWARLSGRASIIATWARHDEARQLAQSVMPWHIMLMLDRRRLLLLEKKIVVAMRAKAKRQHKRHSHFDARLWVINSELLNIHRSPAMNAPMRNTGADDLAMGM